MSRIFKIHPWKIIQDRFLPEQNKVAESVFSIGNGKMGQRGNFEERFSGNTLQGNYIAGIYYPDKTRVGWWKNGYPEYFAKVLNSVNWMGLEIYIDGILLDLNYCKIVRFERVLDMKKGILSRSFEALMENGNIVAVEAQRFYSMHQDEIATLKYRISPKNFSGEVLIKSYLDFDIRNEDANYDEMFWEKITRGVDSSIAFVAAKTKKSGFIVEAAMKNNCYINNELLNETVETEQSALKVCHKYSIDINVGETVELRKYTAITSSFYYKAEDIHNQAITQVGSAAKKGYALLMENHIAVWSEKWESHDIVISGDDASQQAMRFNIFQLNQTYSGKDERLNIGPKGFTGEKYGGSTYWDTEAYCIPFYQSTANINIAKNLLYYRYKHLDKAIENAKKLGFDNGAALYPMVTMNGEECHNEWEITFEEIHRNGAIAYAIYDFSRYTGDNSYLLCYGIKVLIAISRFWEQRFNFSNEKKQYVMLGVTGPNEYENNVNNNWYTSYIARWCLQYTLESLELLKNKSESKYLELRKTVSLNKEELTAWQTIIDNTFLPEDKERSIFLQQEGYLDKEIVPVKELPSDQLPIVHHWSWDRILRSCYIKQADVLQGIYFFEDHFSTETIASNFNFYEPLTVHESSLSPCVHTILAARIGKNKKAFEMFLRTARMDLDNMNSDTEDGCHITSMAGTWMAFVKGIGGMKIRASKLSLSPILPESWKSYSFSLLFRGSKLLIEVDKKGINIHKTGEDIGRIYVFDEEISLIEGKNRVEGVTG